MRGRRALKLLNNINVDDVRRALREMGKRVLRGVRDRRVAIDLHSEPQYHRDKSLLSRIKPNGGTSWGLVQIAIFLLIKGVFLDVLPITVKNVAEDFKMVMQVVLEELDKFDLRLVYADREFAVNEVIKFLLDYGLDFVIAARYQMYRKYVDKLEDVDITYCGVRYTGFLCVRHASGAYLVILRKKEGGEDMIIAFLVRAFSNKPFGHISSIVLAKIATWVLSTHVAIRGRELQSLWLIRPIIIPNTPNNPCQLPSQGSV
ncbi:hypothetical protein SACC_28570 [Saccharolobus caldissimus]|uniref:Transposase IS4-like domain-containing protein n=1 Tax=Saccharolobus caldissimus TaxID=1702097 RepID=A0AAQ4CVK9_9CREN|nr:hypothetical protein SACC_28570 [Saccharolobus caldissimus]